MCALSAPVLTHTPIHCVYASLAPHSQALEALSDGNTVIVDIRTDNEKAASG